MTRWTSDKEVELLTKYSRMAEYGIVEIGVMDGDTTRELCDASTARVFAIDPIIKDSMGDAIGNERSIYDNIRPYGARCTFIRDYSYHVAIQFNQPFDFVFIDGSHIYEDVKQDFLDWTRIMTTPGYVAFHDSKPTEDGRFGGWPGPTQFCDELDNSKDPAVEFVERVDTIRVYRITGVPRL